MTRLSTDAKFARALSAARRQADRHASRRRSATVTLDDGSKVQLAPESKLTVPKVFGPEMRAVKLEGMAEFTVAPGIEQPFNVIAGNTIVVATGTAFTVRSYPGDSAVTVVGEQRHGEGRQGEEHARRARGGRRRRERTPSRVPATAAERDEADAWRTGTLVVNDKPLSQALSMMKRWYGLTILAPQPAAARAEGQLPRLARLDAPGDPRHRGEHGPPVRLGRARTWRSRAGQGGGEEAGRRRSECGEWVSG